MVAAMLAAVLVSTPLADAARDDRQQFTSADHPFLVYLIADDTTARALGWAISSSSLQPEVELCLPHIVSTGLWRLDIRQLGWRHEDWQEVLTAHPYGGYSLLVRGDWLLTELLDAQLSATHHDDGVPAYFRLLYGARVPKTESDLQKFWGVDTDGKNHRGHIEGASRVNRRGRRWIENRDIVGRGYYWFTRDSLRLDSRSDSLEQPTGVFEHDGTEIIIGREKYSSVSFRTGTVQYYALTDGAGAIVQEAPVQLVEDNTRFRGIPTIRTWGSCVSCHVGGLQTLTTNALVDLAAKYQTATFSSDERALRRFHFGKLDKHIARAQEDYAAGVEIHTGWTGLELVEAITSVVNGYDADLDLAAAAVELGVTGEYLQKKLRAFGQSNPLPAGLAMIAGGGKCSRDLFAEQYGNLDRILKAGNITRLATLPPKVVPATKATEDTPKNTEPQTWTQPSRSPSEPRRSVSPSPPTSSPRFFRRRRLR